MMMAHRRSACPTIHPASSNAGMPTAKFAGLALLAVLLLAHGAAAARQGGYRPPRCPRGTQLCEGRCRDRWWFRSNADNVRWGCGGRAAGG